MKKKRTLREIFIPLEIFNSQVVVLVGHTQYEVLEWIKKNIEKPEHKSLALEAMKDVSITHRGRTILLSGGGSIVWIIEQKNSTIVHELFHSTCHILKNRETPLSEDTEEVYAYLLEYLTKSCNI
jgi:hypothetical protein